MTNDLGAYKTKIRNMLVSYPTSPNRERVLKAFLGRNDLPETFYLPLKAMMDMAIDSELPQSMLVDSIVKATHPHLIAKFYKRKLTISVEISAESKGHADRLSNELCDIVQDRIAGLDFIEFVSAVEA